MAKTRRIPQRMNQCAISQQMLEIVKIFGVDNGDKTYLNKKGIDAKISEMNSLSKQMEKMKSRGGVALIMFFSMFTGSLLNTSKSMVGYDLEEPR